MSMTIFISSFMDYLFLIMFTSAFLVELKRRALRKGVWFRVLDRLERSIFSLAARILDRVESPLLGVELTRMVGKLRDAVSGGFARRMREYGFSEALRVAEQAVGWGYAGAAGWASDLGFVRYLTLLDFNATSGWGV